MALEGKEFSHYRLLQIIGSGGMGKVYLAEDIHIRRQVAVKIIELGVAPEPDEPTTSALRLFLREATAIAKLDHPYILPLYDYGKERLDGSYFAYLITPYRAEGSLITWLHTRAQARQTSLLTLRQVSHLIQQAASALQYAHEHQVIHRDVKPANFLIRSKADADAYPDLLLADFGIACLESQTSSVSQNTSGTPTYMAPEQWSAQPLFSSDQYALAVMAYELVTGKPPFQGSPMKLMYAHLHEPPQPPHERNPLLSPTVDAVLLRALAKQPEERFSSIAAFAQDFSAAFQGMDERTRVRVLTPLPSTPRTPEAQPQRGLAGNDASERYYKTQDAMTTNETVSMTDPPFPGKRLQSRRSRKAVLLLVSALLALLVVSMSILWATGAINAQHAQATATAQKLATRTYLAIATATPLPTATLSPEPPTSVTLRVSASGISPTTQSQLTIPSGTRVTLTVVPDHSLLPFQTFTMGIYATDPYGFSELQYCKFPNTATCSYVIAYSSSENTDYTKGTHTFRAFLGDIGGAILTSSSGVTITWS